jgi:hypothetical protein
MHRTENKGTKGCWETCYLTPVEVLWDERAGEGTFCLVVKEGSEPLPPIS